MDRKEDKKVKRRGGREKEKERKERKEGKEDKQRKKGLRERIFLLSVHEEFQKIDR